MNLSTFLHRDATTPTTMSEIRRLHGEIAATDFLGLYAYATQSGAALFDLAFGGSFWAATPSRWLFGIDYGRTQPQALRLLCSRPNVEIRIHDGIYVVDQPGFVPRRDFHAKMAMLMNQATEVSGMVVGSGNFSSNGLRKSVEAGASILTHDADEFNELLRPTLAAADFVWKHATPVTEILDVYEERWSASFFRRVAENPPNVEANLGTTPVFWIEAGYVTKNRGPNRPGNQIDFPRGMSRYFGFTSPANLPANSIIGKVVFETPMGEPVANNLRLGNNMMEKISLPIPETHGFDIYDGKILVFQRSDGRFIMRALEADDFETAFGDRLAEVRVMSSGRRYGHITG
ncbi:TPA: hypothetical protein ACXJGC_000583 [Burkholderia cenocepacia]|uniref:hypothetical protein n=1 Tax=Burkholderia pyrrocinia TaxID=60550 RepID=UPI001575A4B7|nr:hypothetical protein [Burkholderia pyrrocinia]NTX29071.1 hypothetical protein [Burkholderia pyrrocinia]